MKCVSVEGCPESQRLEGRAPRTKDSHLNLHSLISHFSLADSVDKVVFWCPPCSSTSRQSAVGKGRGEVFSSSLHPLLNILMIHSLSTLSEQIGPSLSFLMARRLLRCKPALYFTQPTLGMLKEEMVEHSKPFLGAEQLWIEKCQLLSPLSLRWRQTKPLPFSAVS